MTQFLRHPLHYLTICSKIENTLRRSLSTEIQQKNFWEKRIARMVKKELEASGDLVLKPLEPLPSFIKHREDLWQEFKSQIEKDLASKERIPITIELKTKDGEMRQVEAESWTTTPYELARKHGSKSWADSIVVAKVNGTLWDLNRPLEKDAKIEFVTFDDHEGQQVFWHSSAHMLGEAVERLYGGHLCYGPPIETGYYYDVYMGEGTPASELLAKKSEGAEKSESSSAGSVAVTSSQYGTIETVMKSISNERQPFERLELTKDQLLQMFSYNQFKVRILNEKVTEDRTTVYKCGTLIDLCLGPHVRNTGCLKAFKVTKGKLDAEQLQRVYGISFPEPKQLKEWEKFQEEAAKRDHRRLGREQGLFFFHELSPGSCFFHPRGAHIYNKLVDMIKVEYRKRGFTEVITPNMYNSKLWEISGHWKHYAENMFSFEVEKEQFALKPMNCPGHCLIFDSTTRSWRDLPLRFADFGVLHRNEISGALSGLTRVRRFQQDDAHIFCAPSQIKTEVIQALEFVQKIYAIFNFTLEMVLSTRPDDFMGSIEEWDQAEKALSEALDDQGIKWALNEKDGAFYGPKIDITIRDALKRPFQCATIQLDFQLPNQFKLQFTADDGSRQKPVIIHRAVLGSVERFIAIITENFGGKWPFWISPFQAIVLPIGPSADSYAQKVKQKIFDAGFQIDIETDPGLTINKKVRNAQIAQYNFILVVGDKEAAEGTVNVRTRDNKVHGEVSVEDLIGKFKKFQEDKTINAEEVF